MHAYISMIRRKKTYNQNKEAVEQISICSINCKTKLYLVSFFLEECNCVVTHASVSDRLGNFIQKPGTKHGINFSAS